MGEMYWCMRDKGVPVAYPELVSGGVSKSHKFNGLVKVGAGKGVIRVDLKKKHGGGGGFLGNQKTPLDTPLGAREVHQTGEGHVSGKT